MMLKIMEIIINCVPFHFIVTLTQSLKIELNDNDDNNKENSALIQNDNNVHAYICIKSFVPLYY